MFRALFVVVLAALVAAGCQSPVPAAGTSSGGNPLTTPVGVQGAQMQTGQQGQVGETNSATTYANPSVFAITLAGKTTHLRIEANEDGTVIDATADGEVLTDEQLAALSSRAVVISYGDNAISNSNSSGGGGAAGVEGGSASGGGSRGGSSGGGQ
jgi:hypothetical protein